MDNSVYEVSRDEYAGVVAQINPKFADIEKYHEQNCTIIKIVSKKGVHFTTRLIPEDGEEGYYVFNLPSAEESLPPKAIRKITLETKEEVQAFFDALSKLQEVKKND
jgi:hypothetical protein